MYELWQPRHEVQRLPPHDFPKYEVLGLTGCQCGGVESLQMLYEAAILLELRVEPLLWDPHHLFLLAFPFKGPGVDPKLQVFLGRNKQVVPTPRIVEQVLGQLKPILRALDPFCSSLLDASHISTRRKCRLRPAGSHPMGISPPQTPGRASDRRISSDFKS